MTQQVSPFLESKYGWAYGESGWNIGMDENLLKFSFMFDGNVDSIVASLPPVSNGVAHFNSTDNRFYFGVGTVWYSSPCPKSFIFKIKSNGHFYQFNGTSAVKIDNPSEVDSRLSSLELTVSSLGTAAFQNVEYFATQASLDVVEASLSSDIEAVSKGLRQELAAEDGAGRVGWKRAPLTSAVDSAAKMLSAQSVNIWEFANLITNKPAANDPNTWDWTPAFVAANIAVAGFGPYPLATDAFIQVPPGKYPLTSVDFSHRVGLVFTGGVLVPFDVNATLGHLIKFTGYNRVYNLSVDMNYAMNYDTAVWCRGRYMDFVNPEIWRARCAWLFGDPSWENDPANGVLGDSEINIMGGSTNHGITVARAYGQNTLVTFTGGHRAYSYKWTLPEGDSRKASWEALSEITFVSCGALIYCTGVYVGNYSAQQPTCLSVMQVVSGDPAYVNSYGRFFFNGTHIETGKLLECSAPTAVVQDNRTLLLQVSGCHGYMSVTPGYYIDTGLNEQPVDIRACGFYGGVQNRIIYAPAARTHIEEGSFSNRSIDFFQTLAIRYPTGYSNMCVLNARSSAQAFSPTPSRLRMTTLGQSDINTAMQNLWYDAATGVFTPQVKMRNVQINCSLSFTGAQPTDSTDLLIYVSGQLLEVVPCSGVSPRANILVPSLDQGATLEIHVAQYQSRTADNTPSNKLIITGNV